MSILIKFIILLILVLERRRYMNKKYRSQIINWVIYICTSPSLYLMNIAQALIFQITTDQAMSNTLVNKNFILKFIICTIIIIGLIIFKEIAIYYKNKLVQKYTKEIRQKIIEKPLNDYWATREISNAVYYSTLTIDINILENKFYLPCFSIFEKSLLLFFSCVYVYYINSKVLFILLIFAIPLTLIPKTISNKINNYNIEYLEANEAMLNEVEDILNARTVVKEFNVGNHFIVKANKTFEKIIKQLMKLLKIQYLAEAGIDSISFIAFLVTNFYSLYLFSNQLITFGEVTAIVQLSNTIFWPLQVIIEQINLINSTKTQRNKIKEMTKSEENLKNEVNQNWKTIHVNLMDIKYNEKIIIKNPTFVIKKNDKVLIKGENGSGKSSFLKTIANYLSNNAGYYKIDGISSSDISSLCTYVEQTPIIFDTTILENICLGEKFSEQKINKVIENTNLKELIKNKGYEYKCGKNGENLSGGERQKIHLARALLRNKDFLLLDESFSSIDSKSRMEITEKIFSNCDLTILCVSHVDELEIMKYFNRVIDITDKKMIERRID